MIHFVFSDKDTRYLFLKFDTPEDELWLKSSRHEKDHHVNLTDHINLIDPLCYRPTYSGPPFTQDFLFKYVQPSGQIVYYCAIGLWQEVYKFFKNNNVPYDGLMDHQYMFKRNIEHTFEEFKEIVDSWGLDRKPRPYQYESAYKILQWKQSVSRLATRAGKTLIAYIVFRYCIEYFKAHKILMIVPSIQLVTQGYDDFNEYAEFFKTECIWGGGELVQSSNLTIGTFQSLIKFLDKKNKKYNPHFFDDYDIVFVDETHRATASQIKTIISQPFMRDTKIAFGMTGTIPKEKTIEYYCLKAELGATIQEIRAKYLMDEGYISKVNITQIRFHYKDIDKQRKLFIKCAEYGLSEFEEQERINRNGKKVKEKIKLDNPEFQIQFKKKLPFGINELRMQFYDEDTEDKRQDWVNSLKTYIKMSTTTNMLVVERMMTHFMYERVDYLLNSILPKCDKNTLILAHHTEYIHYITDIIKKHYPDKHIDVITGSVSPKKREQIKQMLKDNNDCILIASYGTLSTGITLSNLCFGVLFESFKSEVVNIQSIGRGLGLSKLKDEFVLYDIIDCFDRKQISNKIYLQGLAKCRIYDEEQYPYKIINVNI